MTSFERYLGDTFELVDVLKSSDQGFVAVVYDKRAQRVCTMKRRNLHSLEIYKTLKELDDTHIPEIYRIFECDGNLVVVEEYIDGQTLEEFLMYQMATFDEKFALEILNQLCECLAVIHKRDIVHRDIKPSNIMLAKGNVVKLIDFGIARKFKPESIADTEFLGTRGYASPEQFGLFDFGQTDARSDIYSLGITIKQILGDNCRGWLLKILNRCTALEPTQRYQSARELLDAIANNRKLLVFKKFLVVTTIFISVFAFPVMLTDIQPTEDEQAKPPVEKPAESSAPAPVDETASLNQPTTFPQIFLVPPTVLPIEPPSFSLEPLPSPVVPEENTTKPRESVNGIDLYLYLNETLTGLDGSHVIEINDWQSWNNYRNGVAFPADWNARLHIENHGREDLIAPLITINIGQEKYSVQKPTISIGQSIDLDIPLANKFAAPIKGVGNLQIVLQAQGRSPIYLNRTFRLIQ